MIKFKLLIFKFISNLYTYLYHYKYSASKKLIRSPDLENVNSENMFFGATNLWKNNLITLEKALKEDPSKIFKNPKFLFAFHLSTYNLKIYYKKQKKFLKKHYGKAIYPLIREDHALVPRIVDPILLTSEARMYHLSHLATFEKETLQSLSNYKTIIEFGAGYGGTTRLLAKTVHPEATISIIDFPTMLKLQFHYLSEVGLKGKLNVISKDGESPKKNKINFIPISYFSSLAKLTPPQTC